MRTRQDELRLLLVARLHVLARQRGGDGEDVHAQRSADVADLGAERGVILDDDDAGAAKVHRARERMWIHGQRNQSSGEDRRASVLPERVGVDSGDAPFVNDQMAGDWP